MHTLRLASENQPDTRPPSDGTPSRAQTPAAPPCVVDLCESDGLNPALRQLAATLVRSAAAEQVWVGLHDGVRTRLVSGAPLGVDDLRSDAGDALVGAMDEALEQGVALAVPPAAPGDAVWLEHRGLQGRLSRCVSTLPLGLRGDAVLAVTLVRAEPFSQAQLDALAGSLAGVAGAVRWMQRADRPWHQRTLDAARHRFALLRRRDARWKRRGAGAAAVALLLLGSLPVDDRLHGAARIEGEQQRVLAAPSDGFVKTAYVRPGDVVRAGDVLLDLVDADLRLERDRWRAQVAQHENAYAAAMAKSERGAAATAVARAAEAQAQLELVEAQLVRGRLVAPFDALVIQGDWTQAGGAPVRQGDSLLTLATQGRQRVVVEVDEVDIERVRVGQTGTLSLSGWTFRDEPLVVERIAPTARAASGRNVFDVQARLARPSAELRPGLVGRGELSAGRTPWLWAAARDALLRIRLTLWRWWG